MFSKYAALLMVALLFTTLSLYSWLLRRPICIDSRLVDKIDMVGTGGTQSIYRCSLRKSITPTDTAQSVQDEVSPRLQNMERFFEALRPLQNRISVSILQNRTHAFKIVDHEIFLSADLLKKEAALEKGVLKIWFRENASSSTLDHSLVEESVTDFLFFVMKGRLPDDLESGSPKWPFIVKTIGSYCGSNWRQMEFDQYCSDWPGAGSKSSNHLVAASLRPLITESMISAYLKLNIFDRRQLFLQLPGVLANLHFLETGVGFTSPHESEQSLVDLSSELSLIMRNFSKSGEPIYQNWMQKVSQELFSRGFSEDLFGARADLLIKLRGISSEDYFRNSVLKVDPRRTVIVMDDKKVFMLPDHEGVDKNLVGRLIANRILFLHCGATRLSELVAFQDISSRVLAVENCGTPQEIRIESYLEGRAEDFARQNLDLKFVELHLPSLNWALKANRVDGNQTLSLAGVSREMFRRQFGWKNSAFDEQSKYFKIDGEIDAIQSYRP